ncbi:PREDICTED: uncharacterized protein LOC109151980 [Ipomoea nil]|uniref:uncharacterized protein LOC109151980 n=1 Tax=Ipomoea nil TaxID=35883 RepID=UPI0009008780|nr:PREDICTED: uncharacterized protein LOC109151980 [Ipomoea nil]
MAENQVAQNPSNSSSSNTTRRCRSIYSSDRDLESASSLSCRICLDSDTREGDELISPCRCKGSQEFVHRECLDHWRSIRAAFQLQVKEVKYDIVTRLKHKLFVVKDFFVHFLIAQALIVVLGGYMYMVDYQGVIHKAVDKYLSFLSSQSTISFYYSMGVRSGGSTWPLYSTDTRSEA